MTDAATESDTPVSGPPDGGPGATGAAEIGWLRAALSSVAILAVGTLGCVYAPNLILNQLDGLSPDVRSYLATGLVVAVVLLMAWGLRRLQARRLI